MAARGLLARSPAGLEVVVAVADAVGGRRGRRPGSRAEQHVPEEAVEALLHCAAVSTGSRRTHASCVQLVEHTQRVPRLLYCVLSLLLLLLLL